MNNVSILVLFYLKQFYIQAVTLATPLWLFHCPPNAPYHRDNTDYPSDRSRRCSLSLQQLQPPTPNSLGNSSFSNDYYTKVHFCLGYTISLYSLQVLSLLLVHLISVLT